VNLLEAYSTVLETSRTIPTHISPTFDNSAMWFYKPETEAFRLFFPF